MWINSEIASGWGALVYGMIKTWIGDFCWDSWTEERRLRGMAKLEGRLYGDFWQILEDIDEQVMKSVSAYDVQFGARPL